jgi:hypothetical protein
VIFLLLLVQDRRVSELPERWLPHAEPEERYAAQEVRLDQVRPEEGGGGRLRPLHPWPQQASPP